jgi:two-component system LytT family response regulator
MQVLKLNCLIVEDEPLAARVVADYVAHMPELRLTGICEDVYAASRRLKEEKADLIFLDINLPKINGMEFIKTMDRKCHIILTTAYHQYALEGFELEVVDYLLKPISWERFTKAVNKVLEYQKLLSPRDSAIDTVIDHMFVRTEGRLEKVLFEEILFVESHQNYVSIHTVARKIITYSSLKNIEALLPAARFVKVQKSYIVAVDKITSLQGSNICVGGTSISLSRKLKEEIHSRVLINNKPTK